MTFDMNGIHNLRGYMAAVAIIAASTVIAFLLPRLMPHASLSLVFLTGVLVAAASGRLGPSLLASILAFLTLNFFFTPPFYTFEVADDGDVMTLAFFLVIATITGNLAARMRKEMARREEALKQLSALYDFSRTLSSTSGADEVRFGLQDQLQQTLGRTVTVYTQREEAVPISSAPTTRLALESGESANTFIVIVGTLEPDEHNIALNLTTLAENALQRIKLAEELETTKIAAETEQLRAALLSSVSHDLRTPLASIIGSTSSLLEYGHSFSEAARTDLLATVLDESRRLDRHIQNLLDMTRLGQGKLSLKRDWVDVSDIIASAVSRLENILDGISLETRVPEGAPLLYVHGALVEQALVNLLDNAARFSPEGGCITIVVTPGPETLQLDICDQGPGIPEEEREKIFDMFYTAKQGDRSQLQGTGLGLAICRGMIAAHGGSVTARSGHDGIGTCFSVTLPVAPSRETTTA
ncbi:sensor histidine kinase [Kineobactrum sediminis]|uniref:histidine kinase n=2 Tax=Kineobactrum sediminis TaxID=1905677 RepID=A0A2N5Y0V4_9GAMM|nr:sensor histidine kinase [Kineobactrum sediminis]